MDLWIDRLFFLCFILRVIPVASPINNPVCSLRGKNPRTTRIFLFKKMTLSLSSSALSVTDLEQSRAQRAVTRV